MKTTYKKAIAASLLSVFALSPMLGFAQTWGNNGWNNGNNSSSSQQNNNQWWGNGNGNGWGNNSFWNRFFFYYWWWNQHNNNWPPKPATTTPATTTPSTNNKVPVIQSVSSPTVLQTGQTGTWKVEAYDPENGNLTYSVDWGEGMNSFAKAAVAEEPFVQTSTFTHSYSNPGTYTVTFKVKDDKGGTTTSTVNVRVRGNPVETPVISNLVATSTGTTTAKVTWTTNVNTDSKVWVSTSSPVSLTGTSTVSQSESVTSHSVNLTGLSPNTLYYVRVTSGNVNGVATSTETSFVTHKAADNTPVITKVTATSTVVAGDPFMVTLDAYDPNDENLMYSVDWGDTASMMKVMALAVEDPFVQTSSFTHVYNDPGTYTATFRVKNESGLETSTTTKVTVAAAPDTQGPVISSIVTTSGGATSTITWLTDEAATSKVYFGLASTTLDINATSTASAGSSTLVTNHSVNLTGLSTSTNYRFVIQSTDSSGNTSTTSQATFSTTSGS